MRADVPLWVISADVARVVGAPARKYGSAELACYYFDLPEGNEFTLDEEGLELRDTDCWSRRLNLTIYSAP